MLGILGLIFPHIDRITSTANESGSFRPGSFRPNLEVGRFGLGRWVDSALGHFGDR